MKKIDYQQYHRYYQIVTEMRKRPNTHLYTTIAFTFLSISLFAWYAIRPTLQTILYLRREIKDKTEVNQKMEEKITALIEAQNNLTQIEPNLPLLSQALPSTPDIIRIMSQLNALAGVTQASISAVRVSDVSVTGATVSASVAQKPGTPYELSFGMTLTGTFEQLQAFLNGMIDMRRIITVEKINFSPSSSGRNESANGPLQLTMKLRAYYLPEKINEQ
ncbi:hypothetical protein A2875_03190 [Candidatus Gottesmanbacteria bacterium RIFCSPHIGHO2_01_FULL_46_14]|uniref:Pilus assembly protein PilO n=2 Tax=Candidatus Gottesmaniibacteriota TaxID=1752720 RepID=A0A1F5ZRA2_9BACT|nr:MAG: hypothetical protein A2875_03190 [Candidatus Gottesmanbacteria bacterium RIFCSPHIGHO2_01_FULL_46_14]OGG30365.1 MAG: hypothetical protein A2971_02090 [Candidatus Gottesmanbacteria bacterium RIFCSPLOWO2_01_FULL_46_21]